MAPLAATIAAGFVVRAGIAFARAGGGRRSARLRQAERRLGLQADERPAEGLRRMTLAQADLAVEALRSAGTGEQGERAVHETRKAIKRLRTLLRLLRRELGEQLYAGENAALRALAHDLAGARDAEVMLATFEKLVAQSSAQLNRRAGVHRLHAILQARSARARRELLQDTASRQRAIGQLTAFRARAGAWSVSPSDRGLEKDARRLYESGRHRYRLAKRGARPHTTRMHEWRKRVKELRYAAEALGLEERSRAPGRSAARRLQRTAERATALSELLGEEHDLAVLSVWIDAQRRSAGTSGAGVGRRTREELLKLIAKRRRKLRAGALREGKRLYSVSGKKFTRRLRAAAPSRR